MHITKIVHVQKHKSHASDTFATDKMSRRLETRLKLGACKMGPPFPHDCLLLGPLICWSGCTVVQATGNRFNQSNTGRNANAAADDAAADASEQLRTFFEDLQACIIAPLY